LKVTPAFFHHYTTGDLQARVTAATSIQQRLSGVTLQVLVTSGLALLNLGLMFYYHAPLALVASAVSLVASCITAVAAVRTVRYLRPLQRLSGEIVGTVVQLMNGVAKLRVAGAEERAFAYWGKEFRLHQALTHRVQHIEDGIAVVNTMLPTLASVILFGGAMRALQHPGASGGDALTAGAFLAFYMAFGVLMSGATRLSDLLMDLLDVAMLWERAKPIVTAPVEVDATKTPPGRLTGKLTVDAVTFRYQEGGVAVLNAIRIQAAPGEFIALVGPSGSGKSTLLRLLLGFDAPEVGAVYYDDQDLSRLDVTAVRRQIGTVLQQSMIMAGSIFENIAAGGLITQDDAWEAALAAGLADEIVAMPMQMNTFVNTGGSNLSGGQRQRLLIARALVRKPTIMLLDEATSALDNRTQAIVTASLEQLQATRVIVAHRLSTIRQADRIYVLDGGRVVQEGNFADLARQDGLFACLIARQEV
jgi:NHLM bacteriocin system ABC transporter ATP-binding protein